MEQNEQNSKVEMIDKYRISNSVCTAMAEVSEGLGVENEL